MSESEEFSSAKDEEASAPEKEENSSDDEPLTKKKTSPRKSKSKPPKKTTKAKKGKKVVKKNEVSKATSSPKEKRKSVALVPTKKKSSDDEEEEYEVEAIVGHRQYNGKLVYKIRWKNYTAIHDTWEDHLSLNCPDLLEMYNIKHNVTIPKRKAPVKRKAGRGRPPKAATKSKKKRNQSVSETTHEDESDFDGEGDNEVDGEEEYEVDRIVEMRTKKDGTREFRVKWKRWSSDYDTWETEDKMNCAELIDKFLLKLESSKSSDAKELRTHRKHTERFTLNTTEHGRRLSRRGTHKQRIQYFDAENSDE